MSGTAGDFEPERELRVLEALAKQHAPASPQYAAVELAAKALLFIHATRQGEAFGEYLKELHADLTDEQREILGHFGLGSSRK